MTDVPSDLQSDGDERIVSRSMDMAEAVRRQIDRIAYLRSVGKDWSKAVEQLRDMVVGLEDPQFWDGVPKIERERIAKLEKDGHQGQARRIKAKWAENGWLTMTINAVPGPGGSPFWMPSQGQLSQQLRILMALLNRNNLLWKTRGVSELPPWLHDMARADEERDGLEAVLEG